MNENKITSMIADNKCEHEVAKMREVLKETEVMIPIIKDKLTECVDDLEEFMEENGEEVKKLNEEIHDKAIEQISLSKGFLESLHEEEIKYLLIFFFLLSTSFKNQCTGINSKEGKKIRDPVFGARS